MALGQAQWKRWDEEERDEMRKGGRRERERMDGGEREGMVEFSARCSVWRCVWGRCFCLRGLRGGGTGMVERLAIHRPIEEEKKEEGFRLDPCSDKVLMEFSRVCMFVSGFLSSSYSD